jgi:hypothetical protein
MARVAGAALAAPPQVPGCRVVLLILLLHPHRLRLHYP